MTPFLEQLAALGETATPENWRVSGASLDGFQPIMAPGGIIVAMLSKLSANSANDAALIILLRNSIPAILALGRREAALRNALKWRPSRCDYDNLRSYDDAVRNWEATARAALEGEQS